MDNMRNAIAKRNELNTERTRMISDMRGTIISNKLLENGTLREQLLNDIMELEEQRKHNTKNKLFSLVNKAGKNTPRTTRMKHKNPRKSRRKSRKTRKSRRKSRKTKGKRRR